jgi:23S rRNA G2445 N2-methylase RlmL
MRLFFVSCPIHFEKELISEIENFWHLLMDLDGLPTREALPEFEIDLGGILFKCSIHLGLQINFFSRIANRVLLRHVEFKARYFDQFEKEFKKIDFSKVFQWPTAEKNISIEIESSKSRLFHEKNLIESMTGVLKNQKINLVKDSDLRLFIRLHNDIVVVSLDTSGEHLHFRGYRKHQGAAPIRENLAALVLQLAGLHPAKSLTILDPFCGAGTILFESAIQNLPQFKRPFPFFKFVSTPALFKSESWSKNYKWLKPYPRKLIGIEQDPQTFDKFILNQKIFSELHYMADLKVFCDNSQKIDLNVLAINEDERLWIVTNPPYGERLASEDVPAILKRFESLKSLSGLAVLHPSDWKFKFERLNFSHSIPFSNQGLKLFLSIFKRAI